MICLRPPLTATVSVTERRPSRYLIFDIDELKHSPESEERRQTVLSDALAKFLRSRSLRAQSGPSERNGLLTLHDLLRRSSLGSMTGDASIESVASAFTQFVRKRLATELIEFYLDVELYRRSLFRDQKTLAISMIERYIERNAPQEINVSGRSRESVLQRGGSPTPEIFDALQEEVVTMLSVEFLVPFLKLELEAPGLVVPTDAGAPPSTSPPLGRGKPKPCRVARIAILRDLVAYVAQTHVLRGRQHEEPNTDERRKKKKRTGSSRRRRRPRAGSICRPTNMTAMRTHGLLRKQVHSFRLLNLKWRRRWFVLDLQRCMLAHFSDVGATVRTGFYTITSRSVVRSLGPGSFEIADCLEEGHRKRRLQLFAPSEHEGLEWCKALHYATQLARRGAEIHAAAVDAKNKKEAVVAAEPVPRSLSWHPTTSAASPVHRFISAAQQRYFSSSASNSSSCSSSTFSDTSGRAVSMGCADPSFSSLGLGRDAILILENDDANAALELEKKEHGEEHDSEEEEDSEDDDSDSEDFDEDEFIETARKKSTTPVVVVDALLQVVNSAGADSDVTKRITSALEGISDDDDDGEWHHHHHLLPLDSARSSRSSSSLTSSLGSFSTTTPGRRRGRAESGCSTTSTHSLLETALDNNDQRRLSNAIAAAVTAAQECDASSPESDAVLRAAREHLWDLMLGNTSTNAPEEDNLKRTRGVPLNRSNSAGAAYKSVASRRPKNSPIRHSAPSSPPSSPPCHSSEPRHPGLF